MRVRLGGLSTVVVAVAVATCGVLMLGGVGPAPAGAGLTGEVLPGVAPSSASSAPATSDPVDEPPDSTAPTSTEATVVPSSTTTPTTTPTTVPIQSPLPLSVSASQTVVGAGGTVDFAGTCPTTDRSVPGSLVVWVISDTTDVIATGVTATEWTYRWVAPTDPGEIASYTFQFWCGDPSGWQGGYPADLQRTVDMVAQAGPPPSSTALIESTPPLVIPETD